MTEQRTHNTMQSQSKSQQVFQETWQAGSKIYMKGVWEHKRPQIAKAVFIETWGKDGDSSSLWLMLSLCPG